MTPHVTSTSQAHHRGPGRRGLDCGMLLVIGLALLAALPLRAQTTLYWDINGATIGAGGSSPSGTWSGSVANWSTSTAGTSGTTLWSSGGIAAFSAGADATGSYTVTVSGTQTLAGLTVEEGSPTFSGGILSFTGASPRVQVASGSTATINSQIAGSNGFTKSGTGTLVVGSTANAYTGATIVSAGTLQLGAGNVISDASALTVASGATFDLNWGNNETVGSIAGAGSINIRSNTFTFGGDNTSTTFSGVLSDNGAYGTIVKQGTGTTTLSGANTFSGPTAINAGALNVQNSSALGGSNYGNTIASGAALQLQGGVSVSEGQFSVTGTGVGATGAIRNISGNNSLSAALDLGGNTTVGSDAGTLTLSGAINLGSSQTLTTTGAGSIVLGNAISGSGSNLTVNGTGTTTLSGASSNSYGGTTTVANGTLQLNKTAGVNATGGGAVVIGDGVGAASSATLILLASNQIPDYTTLLTVNSDGRLALNNFSETIDKLAGTGLIDLSTSGYLNVGINSGSSTFGGSITGTGTLEKSGSGSLTFNSSLNFSGTLTLSGGTLALNGNTLTIGTLHITGSTVIDFGSSSASMLNATNFIIDSGATLSITGWVNSTDYFYAQSWAGAVYNTAGSTPTNQVTFSGYTNSATNWQSYDSQITPLSPVPEPATYGAIFIGLAAAFVGWRRANRAQA